MNALNLVKGKRLTMLQPELASPEDALKSRIAVLLLSDYTSNNSCGGLIELYRAGSLLTSAAAQVAFAKAAARVKLGLVKVGDTSVSGIVLSNFQRAVPTSVLTVSLARPDGLSTLVFNLELT